MKKMLFLGVLALLLGLAPPAWAQSQADIQALIAEIKALKAKVAELDSLKKRVADLECQLEQSRLQKAQSPSPQVLREKGVCRIAPDGKAVAAGSKPAKPSLTPEQVRETGLDQPKEPHTGREAKTAQAAKEQASLDFDGFVRMNYRLSSLNDGQKARGGDGLFNVLALGVDGTWRDVIVDVLYRWYSNQNMIHHAWAGYNFTPNDQGQLGITLTPIGLLPSASHNWFGAVSYFTGQSLAYDLGAKWLHTSGPWDLQVAFFKNPAYGNPERLERYSFDVVREGDQTNQETNQFNARLAYTFYPGAKSKIEVGLSGEWGQLYNNTTDSFGSHWAFGPHLDAKFGPWGLQFEALRYQYNPENPPGVSDDSILRGGFGNTFLVASEATVLVGNLSYQLPVAWGPVTSLLFYNDFSTLLKQKAGWENSYLNTLGCYISADPIFSWVDLIMGKNMYAVGGGDDALAAGDPDADWEAMLNINVGFYW